MTSLLSSFGESARESLLRQWTMRRRREQPSSFPYERKDSCSATVMMESDLSISSSSSSTDDELDNPLKGCLRIKSQEASLKETYGASSSGSSSIHSAWMSSTTTSNNKERRTVQWSTLDVHRHPMQLGDNPAVSYGHPVTIAWHADEHEQWTIDEYEQRKRQTNRSSNSSSKQQGTATRSTAPTTTNTTKRRTRRQLVLSGYRRHELVRQQPGVSQWDLDQALYAVEEIQWQRRASARDGRFAAQCQKLWMRLRPCSSSSSIKGALVERVIGNFLSYVAPNQTSEKGETEAKK